MRALPPMPNQPGAYRWFYADAALGEWTAVVIFMVGAVFSPHYVVAARRGASPLSHCAVNFALYRKGLRRAWVFSEYGALHAGENSLRIGDSSWRYGPGGTVHLDLRDQLAPFGGAIEAHLTLTPRCPSVEPVELVPGQGHYWHPIAPRMSATLSVPRLGVAEQTGHGYHDSNFGSSPLGLGVSSWYWARTHTPQQTLVEYAVRGQAQALQLAAHSSGAEIQVQPASDWEEERSRWGLALPRRRPAQMLESSPFYARMEQRGPELHQVAEVADFGRFAQPYLRWMALFRMRRVAA